MKKTVAIMMGGQSAEHEVSLSSGNQVLENINKDLYEPLPIIIPRKNPDWVAILKKIKKVDCVFLALHGTNGEDGRVQGMCEIMNIAYTGPGVLASALGLDKIRFRYLMQSVGVPIPKWASIESVDQISSLPEKLGEAPYFVKPCNQGSSVGCRIVKKEKDLKSAISKAFRYSDEVIVDEYLPGIELTASVLGNEELTLLPIVEIKPNLAEFFDYSSKYEDGGAEEICPARISEDLAKNAQKIAAKVYKVIGAKGFSRVDFILHEQKLYVLEINTIPGLTPNSLLPKAASVAGISYEKLIDKLINYAFEKK